MFKAVGWHISIFQSLQFCCIGSHFTSSCVKICDIIEGNSIVFIFVHHNINIQKQLFYDEEILVVFIVLYGGGIVCLR